MNSQLNDSSQKIGRGKWCILAEASAIDADNNPCIRKQMVGPLEVSDIFVSGIRIISALLLGHPLKGSRISFILLRLRHWTSLAMRQHVQFTLLFLNDGRVVSSKQWHTLF